MAELVLVLMPKVSPRLTEPDDTFQRDVRNLFKRFDTCQLLKGRLITGIAITSGTVRVSHGLGRAPVGWFVVDSVAANQNIYRDNTITTEATSYLYLKGSATDTVSLWIF